MRTSTFRERLVRNRLRTAAEVQVLVTLCAQAVDSQPAELAAWLSLPSWRFPSPTAEAILRDRYRRRFARFAQQTH